MNTTSKMLTDKIETTTAAATKSVSAAAEMTKDAALNLVSEVSSHASDAIAAVHDMAVDQIADTRDALAKSGDRLADTLRRAAEAPTDGSMQGRVMSAVAGGVSSVADTLRERSFSDMASDVRALARRHPGAFAAGAAVAGFALARFLRASTRHHHVAQSGPDLPFGDVPHHGARSQNKDGTRS